MKALKLFCAVLLALCVLIPNIASAIGIEAAIGVWNQKPQGDISLNGPELSLEDDLKMGDKTRFYGRAKIDMPLLIPNIYLMVTQTKSDGTGQKLSNFQFGDQTILSTNAFTSNLTLNEYDLGLYYGVPFVKTASLGMLNVDAGLNLKVIAMDIEITQKSVRTSRSFTVPVPMVYLGAQFKPLKDLSVEAEVRGLAISSDHYYDLIGRVKYKVLGPAFMAAGYRYEDLQVDAKQVKTNRRIGGPFFEAGVEF